MWKNYGDINFFEYGGCQVRPTYSKEEIKEYPLLESVYDVFYLIREGELTIAALCTVDTDDSWINVPEVLRAIGLEDKDGKYGGLSPERFACELVQYYGVQEFHPIFYNNNFCIKDKELKEWMEHLNIKKEEQND